ncbi:hypothetical protein [Tabrizicola flagellatus]|uniref:hypothetical protein n=1 Tax=Tabrizicola flagellatus TaxID=2593021 RepID=UPI0011F15074|nr:hypothetical protein [Tabrizicola flagellatus]
MALTYPLNRAFFFDTLLISEITFDLPEQLAQSRTAGGEQLTAEYAERLWTGRVELAPMLRHEVGNPEVLLSVLRHAGRSFDIYDRRRPYPLADPTGTLLGTATPTIHAVGVDPREMALAGLPPGYVLSGGDYLSFPYAHLSVTRQALHRVVDYMVVADSAGQTPMFEVTPPLRPTPAVGQGVELRKPFCRAVVVAGSFSPNTGRGNLSEGLGFDFVQTLR